MENHGAHHQLLRPIAGSISQQQALGAPYTPLVSRMAAIADVIYVSPPLNRIHPAGRRPCLLLLWMQPAGLCPQCTVQRSAVATTRSSHHHTTVTIAVAPHCLAHGDASRRSMTCCSQNRVRPLQCANAAALQCTLKPLGLRSLQAYQPCTLLRRQRCEGLQLLHVGVTGDLLPCLVRELLETKPLRHLLTARTPSKTRPTSKTR